MVMIVLSRILSYKPNRLANIIVASIMTIVQAATLFNNKSVPSLLESLNDGPLYLAI